MSSTRERGRHWERVAESFLRKKGLRTRERNYQVRFGEIDLVMLDRGTLVFAEVRYRADSRLGSGADTVTPAKQRRIVSAARMYLRNHPLDGDRPCRFDVVSIGRQDGRVVLDWIRGAFDAA